MSLIQALRSHRLLAILRGSTADNLTPVLETLIDAGIRCVEVTLPTPGSLEAVAALRAAYPDEVTVGVGTVLSSDEVRRVADAGAQFVVSPHLDPAIVEKAARLGLGSLPGVFTPTEAVQAMRSGASAAKLFPAAVHGPLFIKALRGPLPDLPFVPTGGIGLGDVPAWLEAGALAVAVGSPLIGDALDGGPLEDLRKRAKAFVDLAEKSGADA
jgi:2-dehydro-3-deoxyphosphogluconate aldolase / (4S)-4-hydroxy-2-oxoglutarate aldolase